MLSDMDKRKIAIIGLDGVNKKMGKYFIDNTLNIHDFLSTIPPFTPPSWTSIFTGVNPGKHGVIGWQKKYNEKFILTSSSDVSYQRLSEYLDSNGLKSILINIPITYPFSGIKNKDNTIIVSDWASPKQTVFPNYLKKKYNKYLCEPPHSWKKHASIDKKGYPKLVMNYLNERLNIYYDLLENYDWDFYFHIFSEPDWLFHINPEILSDEISNQVYEIFNKIKEFIKKTERIAEITFVVSDHGFEKKNRTFFVNESLHMGGYLDYTGKKNKSIDFLQNYLPKRLIIPLMTRIKVSSSRINHVSKSIKRIAYMIEPPSWGVYVEDSDYVGELKEYLQKFDEIKYVFTKDEIFFGGQLDKMPSLILIPIEGVEFSHKFTGEICKDTNFGDHELHGMFYVNGSQIKENIKFMKVPRVYDIVPTVLHIFNLPIPNSIDGRVLKEIFHNNSVFFKRDSSYKKINNEKDKIRHAIKNFKDDKI